MSAAAKTRRPARARRTPEERAAAKRELMDRLDTFAARVAGMDPEDAEMVVITRLMEHYSERNAQLIVMQRPDATVVRGFHAWKDVDRKVRKGAKGIAILAPAGSKDAEAPSEEKPEGEKGRQFFKITYVFDISDTEPVTASPCPGDWSAVEVED